MASPPFTLRADVSEVLLTPPAGLPAVVDTPERFEDALHQLSQGSGAFSFDAERASGYRYSARAYLVQIKREDGGLHLIDPIPFGVNSPFFTRLNDLISGEEVVCIEEAGDDTSLTNATNLEGDTE